MPFLLTIRHISKDTQDHFGEDEVVQLAMDRVRVGRSADCEQVLADEQLPAVAFTIVTVGNRIRLEPEPGVEVLIEGKKPEPGHELLSGDEFQLGDWTFHLHKTYGDPNDRRRRRGLGMLARLLIGLILLGELSIVVWLPRQINAASRRGAELAKVRTFQLLDDLRQQARKKEDKKSAEADELVRAARQAIAEELDRRARYVRHYEQSLSLEQCHQMYEELQALAVVLDHLKPGGLLQPIPNVDVDAAVKAALQRAGWSAPKP